MPPLTVARVVKHERNETIEDLLRRAAAEHKTPEQVAEDLGVTVQTIRNYMKPLGGVVVRHIWFPETEAEPCR